MAAGLIPELSFRDAHGLGACKGKQSKLEAGKTQVHHITHENAKFCILEDRLLTNEKKHWLED